MNALKAMSKFKKHIREQLQEIGFKWGIKGKQADGG